MAIVSSNLTCGIIVWLLLAFHSSTPDHSSLRFSFVITMEGGRGTVRRLARRRALSKEASRGGFPDKWRSSSPAESRHWREDQLLATFVKASTLSASFARAFIRAPIWGQIQSYLWPTKCLVNLAENQLSGQKGGKGGWVQVAASKGHQQGLHQNGQERSCPPANQKSGQGRQRRGSSEEAFLVLRWLRWRCPYMPPSFHQPPAARLLAAPTSKS